MGSLKKPDCALALAAGGRPLKSGPGSGRPRSVARRARRRARSCSWARLMPGQQAAMNAATGKHP